MFFRKILISYSIKSFWNRSSGLFGTRLFHCYEHADSQYVYFEIPEHVFRKWFGICPWLIWSNFESPDLDRTRNSDSSGNICRVLEITNTSAWGMSRVVKDEEAGSSKPIRYVSVSAVIDEVNGTFRPQDSSMDSPRTSSHTVIVIEAGLPRRITPIGGPGTR